jgi:hypothetical protein
MREAAEDGSETPWLGRVDVLEAGSLDGELFCVARQFAHRNRAFKRGQQ